MTRVANLYSDIDHQLTAEAIVRGETVRPYPDGCPACGEVL